MKNILFFLLSIVLLACNATNHQTNKPKNTSAKDEVVDVVQYFEGTQQIKMKGQIKSDSIRVGMWSAWHPNGELHSEVQYIDGLRHGPIRTWFESGTLRLKGFYANGEPIGEWLYFNKDGEVIKRVNHP